MIAGLEAALDEVCGADPATLADAESIEALHRCLARLEAAATRASAAFDARGDWAVDGARSAAAWISVRCRLPKARAARRVHLGRELRHLPVAEEAWLAGEVGEAHVGALAGARTPAAVEAMERDEASLVAQAKVLRPDQFARVMA